MKKPIRLAALTGLVLFVLASCTTVSFQGLQMQKDLESYSVVKEFEITMKDTQLLGSGTGYGLISLNQPDERIFQEIRREIDKVSGDAAIDVTIEYKTTFTDMLLNGATAALYSPRTIKVTGTIVSYN
jgi:hypothetical protein